MNDPNWKETMPKLNLEQDIHMIYSSSLSQSIKEIFC